MSEEHKARTREMIKVMQAYVDGQEIEANVNGSKEWGVRLKPSWDFARCEYRIASGSAPNEAKPATDQFTAYFQRQVTWSLETFGPAPRTNGIIDHIRKELAEIEAAPYDLMEWVDVAILAMDGFHRHGGNPAMFLTLLERKQVKNIARNWPDWRTKSEDAAIEHDRSGE